MSRYTHANQRWSQKDPIPLRNLVSLQRTTVPSEITHTNLQPTIELTMGVYERDLGHVADDIAVILNRFGKAEGRGSWAPFAPGSASKRPLDGYAITLTGEYARMQDTFRNLGLGLILASLLVYFLMVALFKSYPNGFSIMIRSKPLPAALR